ncbi:hypothetical protein, partial [Enterobacter hormaechei]|uniref:hypothetical protein n=1 Tax=Enterobacter hormaechei TaxID=158836 RepID=UPI001C8F3A3B
MQSSEVLCLSGQGVLVGGNLLVVLNSQFANSQFTFSQCLSVGIIGVDSCGVGSNLLSDSRIHVLTVFTIGSIEAVFAISTRWASCAVFTIGTIQAVFTIFTRWASCAVFTIGTIQAVFTIFTRWA